MVELKTTDTSFRLAQSDIYRELQTKIRSTGSATFLLDDLTEITESSNESGKYQNVRNLLSKHLFNGDLEWINFGQLPETIEHFFSVSGNPAAFLT